MQTLQSVLLCGRYEWDCEALPIEELDARLTSIREVIRRNAWDGLVIYGDARENAALCYVSNVVPNQRWDLALIDMERPMRIIASIGPRDLPAITRLTWVEDVRASRKVREPLVNWLMEIWSDCDCASRAARVGVVNLDRMRADVGREVAEICGELCEMADATQALAELRLRKSACERALLRRSYEILQGALEQIRRQLQSGMAIAEAMIAGERRARRDGAQDVRLLCGSGDRGSLQPVHDAVGLAPAAAWTVYIAVRYCGYWTEAASVLASGMSPAAQAVHATLARAAGMVRPGVSGGELIEVVAAELADYKPHPMLGRRLGRAQGLSLDEEHWIAPDSGDVVVEDGVYTIMAGVGDARRGYFLGSVTVIVGREYNEVMWPVPPANSTG